MSIAISVVSADKKIRSQSSSEDEVILVFDSCYKEGDLITIKADASNEKGVYITVQLDKAMFPTFCWLEGGYAEFRIPFNEKRVSYPLHCFTGERHYLYAAIARKEIRVRKNLAFNPYDTHENQSLFPHSKANVETRGESIFASRNAIDGYLAGNFHGEWPYTSWGINQDPKAALTLDFGRTVIVDEIVLYLRSDFPHDAWWKEATVEFSDGSEEVFKLKKTGSAQKFPIKTRKINSLILKKLIKAEDPSPFPALTQIQVMGIEDV